MIGNKILTICHEGNSRSVGLAWLLKGKYNKEALACGINKVTPETFKMLVDWADTIIVTASVIHHPLLDEMKEKVLFWDVGHDRYFRGFEDDLIAQYENYYGRELSEIKV